MARRRVTRLVAVHAVLTERKHFASVLKERPYIRRVVALKSIRFYD